MKGMMRNRRSDLGFTLPEVLVAAFLLGVATVAVVGVAVFGTRSSLESERQNVALGVVNEKLEEIRVLSYEDVGLLDANVGLDEPDGVVTRMQTITSNQQTYELYVTITNVDDPNNGTVLDGQVDESDADYKKVEVTAVWQSASGTQRDVSVVTYVAPSGALKECTPGEQTCSGYAPEGACVPFVECPASGVCPAANDESFFCPEGAVYCAQPDVICTNNSQCGAGEVCNLDTGSCSLACTGTESCSCPNGYSCNETSGICDPPPPTPTPSDSVTPDPSASASASASISANPSASGPSPSVSATPSITVSPSGSPSSSPTPSATLHCPTDDPRVFSPGCDGIAAIDPGCGCGSRNVVTYEQRVVELNDPLCSVTSTQQCVPVFTAQSCAEPCASSSLVPSTSASPSSSSSSSPSTSPSGSSGASPSASVDPSASASASSSPGTSSSPGESVDPSASPSGVGGGSPSPSASGGGSSVGPSPSSSGGVGSPSPSASTVGSASPTPSGSAISGGGSGTPTPTPYGPCGITASCSVGFSCISGTCFWSPSGGGSGSGDGSDIKCTDGIDNDGDGFIDADDSGCYAGFERNNPGAFNAGGGYDQYEGIVNPNKNDCDTDPNSQCGLDLNYSCTDNLDNEAPNGDGFIDGSDPECTFDSDGDPSDYDYEFNSESGIVECNNLLDDDGDGYSDTFDGDCHTDLNPFNGASYNPNDISELGSGAGNCHDGLSTGDADYFIDEEDPDCHYFPPDFTNYSTYDWEGYESTANCKVNGNCAIGQFCDLTTYTCQ